MIVLWCAQSTGTATQRSTRRTECISKIYWHDCRYDNICWIWQCFWFNQHVADSEIILAVLWEQRTESILANNHVKRNGYDREAIYCQWYFKIIGRRLCIRIRKYKIINNKIISIIK